MKLNKMIKPRKNTLLILFAIILIGVVLLKFNILNQTQLSNTPYRSTDLKISFNYSKEWYIDDRDYNLLLTNYPTNQNRNEPPKTNQIEIQMHNASLCQPTLDQDVLLGGCGEGVNTKNEILSKDVKKVGDGLFTIYKIKYPTGKEATLYYLQKDERILQISKKPDPSMFEKEFEEIINSIKFL